MHSAGGMSLDTTQAQLRSMDGDLPYPPHPQSFPSQQPMHSFPQPHQHFNQYQPEQLSPSEFYDPRFPDQMGQMGGHQQHQQHSMRDFPQNHQQSGFHGHHPHPSHSTMLPQMPGAQPGFHEQPNAFAAHLAIQSQSNPALCPPTQPSPYHNQHTPIMPCGPTVQLHPHPNPHPQPVHPNLQMHGQGRFNPNQHTQSIAQGTPLNSAIPIHSSPYPTAANQTGFPDSHQQKPPMISPSASYQGAQSNHCPPLASQDSSHNLVYTSLEEAAAGIARQQRLAAESVRPITIPDSRSIPQQTSPLLHHSHQAKAQSLSVDAPSSIQSGPVQNPPQPQSLEKNDDVIFRVPHPPARRPSVPPPAKQPHLSSSSQSRPMHHQMPSSFIHPSDQPPCPSPREAQQALAKIMERRRASFECRRAPTAQQRKELEGEEETLRKQLAEFRRLTGCTKGGEKKLEVRPIVPAKPSVQISGSTPEEISENLRLTYEECVRTAHMAATMQRLYSSPSESSALLSSSMMPTSPARSLSNTVAPSFESSASPFSSLTSSSHSSSSRPTRHEPLRRTDSDASDRAVFTRERTCGLMEALHEAHQHHEREKKLRGEEVEEMTTAALHRAATLIQKRQDEDARSRKKAMPSPSSSSSTSSADAIRLIASSMHRLSPPSARPPPTFPNTVGQKPVPDSTPIPSTPGHRLEIDEAGVCREQLYVLVHHCNNNDPSHNEDGTIMRIEQYEAEVADKMMMCFTYDSTVRPYEYLNYRIRKPPGYDDYM